MQTRGRLLDLMQEAGLSQAELARRLGSHRSTVNCKLHGRRRVVVREAMLFASILSERLGREVTVEELFGPEAAA